MADRGIDFAGDGAKDVSNINYDTQPTASKSGSGPIVFTGNGEQDCSGVISTNNPKESVLKSNEVQFVGD